MHKMHGKIWWQVLCRWTLRFQCEPSRAIKIQETSPLALPPWVIITVFFCLKHTCSAESSQYKEGEVKLGLPAQNVSESNDKRIFPWIHVGFVHIIGWSFARISYEFITHFSVLLLLRGEMSKVVVVDGPLRHQPQAYPVLPLLPKQFPLLR